MASSADPPDSGNDIAGVEDPTEYKQQKRIQFLLEASQRYLEQRRKAKDLLISGEIDNYLARSIVRDAVEEYILLSENKVKHFIPHDIGLTGDGEFDTSDLGEEEELAVEVWFSVPLGDVEYQNQTQTFEGLSSYLNAPNPIEFQHIETTQSMISGTERETYAVEVQIPMSVSQQAFRALNYFWHEMGMDLDLKHKLPTDRI